MAMKFSETRCAHCLKYCDDITSDHVFPKSWYPETTPDSIEKWQMPACRECNSRLGKIESELLLKFGLCVAPFAPGSLGTAQKAMRSIKPEYGRNQRDAEHRVQRREKVLRETIDPTTVPVTSIFPGFGFHSGIEPSEQLGVLVSDDDLRTFAEKLIRGTTWVIDKRYIEPEYEIKAHFVLDPKSSPFFEPLIRFGISYSLGPGLLVVRAVAVEDGMSGLYYIEIWRQVFMYVCVSRKKEQDAK